MAVVELAERFLPALIAATRASLEPTDDEQLADEAAIDALLNYAEKPAQYNLTKMELARYLRMAARGDLRNLRAKEIRRRRRLAPPDVEVGQLDRNIERLEDQDGVRANRVEREALALGRTQEEREVLRLMLEGERRTEAFAKVLGIGHLSQEEQRRAVKLAKDRLKKRLERSGLVSEYEQR